MINPYWILTLVVFISVGTFLGGSLGASIGLVLFAVLSLVRETMP